MDIFTKLKSRLSDFSKVSAHSAREGMEKLGDLSTEYIMLNKAKMEKKSIEKAMDDIYQVMGRDFYEAHRSKKLRASLADLKDLMSKISEQKQLLTRKEQEIRSLYQKLSPEIIEKEKFNSLQGLLRDGGATLEFLQLASDSPSLGKRIKNLKLPSEVLVGTIYRDGEMIIPDGSVVIREGDQLTLIGKKAEIGAATKLLAATES